MTATEKKLARRTERSAGIGRAVARALALIVLTFCVDAAKFRANMKDITLARRIFDSDRRREDRIVRAIGSMIAEYTAGTEERLRRLADMFVEELREEGGAREVFRATSGLTRLAIGIALERVGLTFEELGKLNEVVYFSDYVRVDEIAPPPDQQSGAARDGILPKWRMRVMLSQDDLVELEDVTKKVCDALTNLLPQGEDELTLPWMVAEPAHPKENVARLILLSLDKVAGQATYEGERGRAELERRVELFLDARQEQKRIGETARVVEVRNWLPLRPGGFLSSDMGELLDRDIDWFLGEREMLCNKREGARENTEKPHDTGVSFEHRQHGTLREVLVPPPWSFQRDEGCLRPDRVHAMRTHGSVALLAGSLAWVTAAGAERPSEAAMAGALDSFRVSWNAYVWNADGERDALRRGWTLSSDGADDIDSLRTAPDPEEKLVNNEQAVLETTVLGPAKVSFHWKAERGVGDELVLDIVQVSEGATGTERRFRYQGQDAQWKHRSVDLALEGAYRLRWAYVKDNFDPPQGIPGAAWIDQVMVTGRRYDEPIPGQH